MFVWWHNAVSHTSISVLNLYFFLNSAGNIFFQFFNIFMNQLIVYYIKMYVLQEDLSNHIQHARACFTLLNLNMLLDNKTCRLSKSRWIQSICFTCTGTRKISDMPKKKIFDCIVFCSYIRTWVQKNKLYWL